MPTRNAWWRFRRWHSDGQCRPRQAATNPNLWGDLDIELKGIIEPCSDIVMLTYEAHATRENGEPHAALVSTGYVHRVNGWKMIFHSQTPIEVGARQT